MSEHTPGPWQVIEKKIPHFHKGGHHTLRMIYTSWVDGQFKDFAPVVGQSWGLPEKEGDPAVPLIWLEEADARLIARAPEMAAEIERLTARVQELEGDLNIMRLQRDAKRFTDGTNPRAAITKGESNG